MRISDWSSDVFSSDLWDAICEREPPNGPRNPEYRAWLAESMGAGRLVAEIEREIADTPAQGYAGLLIKARLAVELVDADDSDPYALNALALLADPERLARSEERRVGKECCGTCRSR